MPLGKAGSLSEFQILWHIFTTLSHPTEGYGKLGRMITEATVSISAASTAIHLLNTHAHI